METQAAPQRVLIVDDAPIVREALRWIFSEATDVSLVGEASNGREALIYVSQLQPDVVILDIELPDLDGYTVARSIKALPHAPIVLFLSVHSDAITRYQAMAAGGDSFVEKGVGWLPLIQEIRRLISQRQAGQ